jgi:hypothetical protein
MLDPVPTSWPRGGEFKSRILSFKFDGVRLFSDVKYGFLRIGGSRIDPGRPDKSYHCVTVAANSGALVTLTDRYVHWLVRQFAIAYRDLIVPDANVGKSIVVEFKFCDSVNDLYVARLATVFCSDGMLLDGMVRNPRTVLQAPLKYFNWTWKISQDSLSVSRKKQ